MVEPEARKVTVHREPKPDGTWASVTVLEGDAYVSPLFSSQIIFRCRSCFDHPLPDLLVRPIIDMALAEDLGRAGDITGEACIDADARLSVVWARAAGRPGRGPVLRPPGPVGPGPDRPLPGGHP